MKGCRGTCCDKKAKKDERIRMDQWIDGSIEIDSPLPAGPAVFFSLVFLVYISNLFCPLCHPRRESKEKKKEKVSIVVENG